MFLLILTLNCVGFPERFAQEALGHGSKAVARAYAKKAKVLVPSLEAYETKIVELEGIINTSVASAPDFRTWK